MRSRDSYDSFRSLVFFGSGGGSSGRAGTRSGNSDGIGSGGSVGTWPWHYHEGQGTGHLAEGVADVVDRLALHPEPVDFQDLVTWRKIISAQKLPINLTH